MRDQQARYGGEFIKLLAEKFARQGHRLPVDQFEFNVTEATHLMYRDDCFDFVCAINTFQHIPDPPQALAEIARVLRPEAHAYIYFDPIWTADTGHHFPHRVGEPWAHLVLDEAQFVARMREAGAENQEVDDFRWAMNRQRLAVYQDLFRLRAPDMQLEVRLLRAWSGVVEESSLDHANFKLASATYSREELMTRGMVAVVRKR